MSDGGEQQRKGQLPQLQQTLVKNVRTAVKASHKKKHHNKSRHQKHQLHHSPQHNPSHSMPSHHRSHQLSNSTLLSDSTAPSSPSHHHHRFRHKTNKNKKNQHKKSTHKRSGISPPRFASTSSSSSASARAQLRLERRTALLSVLGSSTALDDYSTLTRSAYNHVVEGKLETAADEYKRAVRMYLHALAAPYQSVSSYKAMGESLEKRMKERMIAKNRNPFMEGEAKEKAGVEKAFSQWKNQQKPQR